MGSKGRAFWAVFIVEHNGEWHFLRGAGGGGVSVYSSKKSAETIAESIREGLGGEVQRVSVVRYSRGDASNEVSSGLRPSCCQRASAVFGPSLKRHPVLFHVGDERKEPSNQARHTHEQDARRGDTPARAWLTGLEQPVHASLENRRQNCGPVSRYVRLTASASPGSADAAAARRGGTAAGAVEVLTRQTGSDCSTRITIVSKARSGERATRSAAQPGR